MEQTGLKLLYIFLVFYAATGSDEQEGLQAHNNFRKIHNAAPLTLNSEMSASAQSHAKKLADSNIFEHSSSKDGENIAFSCSQEAYGSKDATKAWYAEVCKPGYTFSASSGFSAGTGHFTQIAWKGSKELGIGTSSVKRDGNSCVYVVGRYRPRGNMQGTFAENVVKGSFTNAMCDKLNSIMNEGGGSAGDANAGGGAGAGDGGGGGGDGNSGGGKGDNTAAGAGNSGSNVGGEGGKNENNNAGGGIGGNENTVGDGAGNGEGNKEGMGSNSGGGSGSNSLTEAAFSNVPEAAKTIAKAAATGAKVGGIAGAKAGAKSGKEAAATAGANAGASAAGNVQQKHIMSGRKRPVKLSAGVKMIPDDSHAFHTSYLPHHHVYLHGRDETNDLSRKLEEVAETAGSKAGAKAGAEAGRKMANKQAGGGEDKGGSKSFEEAGLKAHNIFRNIHGVPDMTLDEQMSADAKTYAQTLANSGQLEHSKDRKNTGENLASACSSENTQMSAEEATKNWYGEVCTPGHDFNSDGDGSVGTGHFTQVVWKTSTKLGMGMATGKKDDMYCTYVVGRYRDAGNFIGRFKENVPKGDFSPDICNKLDELIKDISSGGGSNEAEGGAGANSGQGGAGSTGGGSVGGNESEGGSPGGNVETSGAGGSGGASEGNEEEILQKAKEAAASAGTEAGKIAGERIGSELAKASAEKEITPNARKFTSQMRKANVRYNSRGEVVPSAQEAMLNSMKQLKNGKRIVMTFKRNGIGDKSPEAAAQHAGAVAGAEAGATAGAAAAAKLAKEQLLNNPGKGGSNDAEPGPNTPGGTAQPGKGSSGDNDPSPSGSTKQEGGAQQGGGDGDPAPGEEVPVGSGSKTAEDSYNGKPTENTNSGSNEGGGKQDNGETGANSSGGNPTENTGSNSSGSSKANSKELKKACALAAKEGAEVGAKAGSEAAVKTVDAAKRHRINKRFYLFSSFPHHSFETHPTAELYMTPGTNYPSGSEMPANEDSQKTSLRKKASEIGRKIGAEKGAQAAAAAVVDAVGGDEQVKAEAVEKAAEIGKKVGEESKPVDNSAGNTGSGGEGTIGGGSNGGAGSNTGGGSEGGAGINTGGGGKGGAGTNTGGGSEGEGGANTGGGSEGGAGTNTGGGSEGGAGANTGGGSESGAGTNTGGGSEGGAGSNTGGGSEGDTGSNTKPPSPESQSGASVSSSEFAKRGLEAHNIFRKLHGTPPMKLNDEMSKSAEEYAKKLVAMQRMEHSTKEGRDNAGENLAYSCTSASEEMKAEQAVHNWYEEVCDPGYTFGSNSPPGGVLHFTQVVWKGSAELGMGKAVGQQGSMTCTYVVGRYKVAGNMGGEYVKNVPQGQFTKATCNKLQDMIKNIGGETSKSSEINAVESPADPFMEQALTAHNDFRDIHHVSSLRFDDQLNQEAQQYAEELARRGKLEHARNIKDGENLAMKCLAPQEKEPSGSFFTTLWYEEVCNPGYDFTSEKFNKATGHFTQVTWDGSKNLGIGRARSKIGDTDCVYVVARYRPAGNYEGEFLKNVLKGDYDQLICKTLMKRHLTPRYFSRRTKHSKKYSTWIL